jgi:hypothetical protein
MGHPERLESPHAQQASHSRCLHSPHCGLTPSLTLRFGGLDGLWLHYGPIGTTTTPVAVHRDERAAIDRNAGCLDLPTRQRQATFAGCHLDLFCLDHNPGGGASRHVERGTARSSVGWCVYAVAWEHADGPHVTWKAPGLGLQNEGFAQFSGTARPGSSVTAELARLGDLLAGGSPGPGRPPRWRDPGWREIALRGLARKAAFPQLPYDTIAESIGLTASVFREQRRILRREQEREIHLLGEDR